MKMNEPRSILRADDGTGEEVGLGLDVIERITRPRQGSADLAPDLHRRKASGAAQRHTAEDVPAVNGAHIDPLTGLANRTLLLSRLEQALLRHRTLDNHVVAFHIELNNLNFVDSQLGTPVANAILQEISHRLLSVLRSEDTVARVGPSELVVAVSLQDETTVGLVAKRIEAAFESQIALADREVHMWVTLHNVEAHMTEGAVDLLDRLERSAQLETSGTSTSWSLTMDSP